VKDGVLVVLDFFNNTGIFNIEDAKNSRLESSSKIESLGVWGKTQTVII
jgi:hypothetical protein